MASQPNDELPAEPVPDVEQDVEGHSILSSIATSGVLRSRSAETDPARAKVDEHLPALTKPFPSMRAERRK